MSFDVRSDSGGKDPDAASPTLRRYHQMLWSKQLPTGALFALDTVTKSVYLHHRSAAGEFKLSSDVIVPTYSRRAPLEPVLRHLPRSDVSDFIRLRSTVGAFMVFPSQRVDHKVTINGARGLHPRIADRMDLTLECIRLHYRHEGSPLASTLDRYADFFELFGDFTSYVDFFLLQDLVTPGGAGVRFFIPFHDFCTPAVPADGNTYERYRRSSMEFIRLRNQRIDAEWGSQREAGVLGPSRPEGGHEHVVMGRVRRRR